MQVTLVFSDAEVPESKLILVTTRADGGEVLVGVSSSAGAGVDRQSVMLLRHLLYNATVCVCECGCLEACSGKPSILMMVSEKGFVFPDAIAERYAVWSSVQLAFYFAGRDRVRLMFLSRHSCEWFTHNTAHCRSF